MKNNVFTTKLLDLILIENHLFLVLEYMDSDMKKVLTTASDFSE